MPRVTSHTRSSRATKRPYTCRHCSLEITSGQRYYEWEKRYGGPQRVHVACGYPKPSMLSNRKTAVIQDEIQDVENSVSAWEPSTPDLASLEGQDTFEFDADLSELESLIEPIADSARDVASEYESGADNMPEGLQDSPTAEAMREVASELESWADDITDGLSNVSDPDIPERDTDESDEDWQGRIEEAISSWADEAREAATDRFGDLPEYQG